MSAFSRKRKGEPLEIADLYVAIGRSTASGDEGIAAEIIPGVGHMPLVSSRGEFLADLAARGVMARIARTAGEEILIVRFERAEILRVIKP